jgi:DNA-binding NarL/FixJ family response regulator
MSLPYIRVALVDDHAFLLESFSALLELDSRFEVVGTATTAEAGVALVREQRPDVCVFDVDFEGLDSFDLVPGLEDDCPEVKIIFLTAHYSDVFLHQALSMNARGYLIKNESALSVRDSIVRVHRGEFAFSSPIANRLVFDEKNNQYKVCTDNLLCSLTITQLSILRHLARGESVKLIAHLLGKSEKSIDSHKYRIMHKLQIHDRVELCRYAIREGLTLV